jgi:hypothetical protein
VLAILLAVDRRGLLLFTPRRLSFFLNCHQGGDVCAQPGKDRRGNRREAHDEERTG